MLEPLVLQYAQNNVAKTIGFTTYKNIVLVKRWVYIISKKHVANTSGFTTFANIRLQKLLVLQHVQKQCC